MIMQNLMVLKVQIPVTRHVGGQWQPLPADRKQDAFFTNIFPIGKLKSLLHVPELLFLMPAIRLRQHIFLTIMINSAMKPFNGLRKLKIRMAQSLKIHTRMIIMCSKIPGRKFTRLKRLPSINSLTIFLNGKSSSKTILEQLNHIGVIILPKEQSC